MHMHVMWAIHAINFNYIVFNMYSNLNIIKF